MEKLSLPEAKLKLSDEIELHMSYGMFNDIMRIVGNVEDVTYLLINDAMTRDLIIRRLFTDNGKAITDEKELIDPHEITIAPAEISIILAWVADHVTHFLVSTGRGLQETLTKYKTEEKEENQSSESLKTGSED